MAKKSPAAEKARREVTRLRGEIAKAIYDLGQLVPAEGDGWKAYNRALKHLLVGLQPSVSVGEYDNT